MTAPYITVPFQAHPGFGTVTPSFGFVQQPSNIWGVGISNTIAQPSGINAFSPTHGMGNHSLSQFVGGMLPYGAAQQQGVSQVVAYVPVQQNAQSSLLSGASVGQTQPLAIECSENNNEFIISFDVPGISAEDLDVSLTGNTVQINGSRRNSQENGTLNYSEISRGDFSRAVALPFEVTAEKTINTSLENGVLKIRLNKSSSQDRKASSTTRKMKIG